MGTDKLTIVSTDGHISPPKTDYRQFCPPRYLPQFDEWAAQDSATFTQAMRSQSPAFIARVAADRFEEREHYDMQLRLREMDRDGVAAEITFHGSLNDGPFPFTDSMVVGIKLHPDRDRELATVGQQIWNDWLAANLCAAPERFIGVAYVPLWDVDAAVAELHRCAELGLRAVNLPAPSGTNGIATYDSPELEPFWAACVDRGMSLVTHSGTPTDLAITDFWFLQLEAGGWPNRRGVARMVFGGVFERHPSLNVMLVENTGLANSWTATMAEWDSVWAMYPNLQAKNQVLRRPSEYAASNVYIGASFLAPFEVKLAEEHGYTDRVCWGRDFPHPEGSWSPYQDEDAERMTHLQLRHALAGASRSDVEAMVGGNAIRACNLDAAELAAVGERINAPTYEQLSVPLEKIPEHGAPMAYRTKAYFS